MYIAMYQTRSYSPTDRQEAVASPDAIQAAIARLRLPPGTKAFVPYEDDYDQEGAGGENGACLWLRRRPEEG